MLKQYRGLILPHLFYRFSNRGPAPQSRRLYVEGLTRYVDTDWLHKVFSECGEIDNIETAPIRGHARSRGYAYVEYKDQEAADKAWVTLHGG